MDFDFSDDQYQFRDTLRGFLKDHFSSPSPKRPRWTGDEIDMLWKGLAELGLFSVLVPERLGGLGMNFVDLSLLLEELGRALAPASVADTLVATDVIVRFGNEKQQRSMLPEIAAGRLRVSLATAEETGALSAEDLETLWTGSVLQGGKILVADADKADRLLVLFNGADKVPCLGFLDPRSAGVRHREIETLDLSFGYHEVRFSEAVLPAEDVIADGPAIRCVPYLLDASALAAATLLVGICGSVFERTLQFVKERHQFGKPLASCQAIKHRCADMYISLDSSRSSVYYAAWAIANDASDAGRAVSIAKSYSGDASRFICNEGTQLHGGMGFTWELGLHLYLRRAKMLEYSYGDAVHHRKRLLAETLRELKAEA